MSWDFFLLVKKYGFNPGVFINIDLFIGKCAAKITRDRLPDFIALTSILKDNTKFLILFKIII